MDVVHPELAFLRRQAKKNNNSQPQRMGNKGIPSLSQNRPIQAFFCTLLKKLNHEKNSKNQVQEKNSAKFCPKTQPTAGFSLLKNYKKTPFMKKTGIFAPKTQFFPFKTQCTAGLRPELSCRKVYKKKA